MITALDPAGPAHRVRCIVVTPGSAYTCPECGVYVFESWVFDLARDPAPFSFGSDDVRLAVRDLAASSEPRPCRRCTPEPSPP